MSTQTTGTSIRKEIVVNAPIERAFRVFIAEFDKVKPHEHNLLAEPIAQTVFEPRAGGHIIDRGVGGSECRWARVLAYEPPHRVVFTWEISPQWQLEADSARASEVEVRFVSEDPRRTRVVLEHRNLDNHLEGWESLRDAVAGAQGWPLYLERYSALLR